MKMIDYEITADGAEWTAVSGRRSNLCLLRFGKGVTGELRLGDSRLLVKDGLCTVDSGSLPDGDYSPSLKLENGERIAVEGLRVRGKELSVAPTEDGAVRRYFKKTRELEKRLVAAEEKIEALTLMCRGYELFK